MSALDVLVCQNMEVFQATEADASAYDAAEAGRVLGDPSLVAPALEAGQVGFRCVHTAGKLGPQQAIPPPAAVVYPASVSAVSSALSAVGREHFARCPSLPQEVRAAFGEARAAEQEEARKGRAGGKDEWRRIGFLDFCADFCGKVGVRNRDPLRSGLAYWGGGVGHAAATSAGLAAAEAVLAMAATPLTSRRDRPQVQPGPGPSAAKYLPPTPGAPVPPGFAFFYDGYSAWICRCKYAHTHTQMGWMRMTSTEENYSSYSIRGRECIPHLHIRSIVSAHFFLPTNRLLLHSLCLQRRGLRLERPAQCPPAPERR